MATFGGEFDKQAKVMTINKLHHRLCGPAPNVHIVPQVQALLLSTSKIVNADYIAVYDKQEVNFYAMKTGCSQKADGVQQHVYGPYHLLRTHRTSTLTPSDRASKPQPAIPHTNYQALQGAHTGFAESIQQRRVHTQCVQATQH